MKKIFVSPLTRHLNQRKMKMPESKANPTKKAREMAKILEHTRDMIQLFKLFRKSFQSTKLSPKRMTKNC